MEDQNLKICRTSTYRDSAKTLDEKSFEKWKKEFKVRSSEEAWLDFQRDCRKKARIKKENETLRDESDEGCPEKRTEG